MRNLIVITALIILVSACSRYDDGPLMSLRSPEKRLLGLWEITELKVNDIDLISAYREDSAYVKFSIIEYDELFINIVKEGRSGAQMASSVLTLEDNKTLMRFELTRQVSYDSLTKPMYDLVPPLEFDNAWTIQRLTSNEFSISITNDIGNYRLTFGKLEKY
jgi:hypothetical protein